MNYCIRCGKNFKGTNCITNGICLDCSKNDNQIIEFKYECPDCHGKYNVPGSYPKQYEIGTFDEENLIWKCPFCNRIMEGL